MANPFVELATVAVSTLNAASLPAVRTRMSRFNRDAFASVFSGNPAVIVSKSNLSRSMSKSCRDSRSATVALMITVLDQVGRCDPLDPTVQDTFDEYVNSVESALSKADPRMVTPNFGTAIWVSSTEVDDNDVVRGRDDFETQLEIVFNLEHTGV